MGYAIVPNLKDEAVVCQGECQHHDCAALRQAWGHATCAMCGKPMIAGQAYYMAEGWRDHPERPLHVHASCLYDTPLQEPEHDSR